MNDELLAMIERELLSWPGVSKVTESGGTGQGGFLVPPFTSYRFGRRELGHVHEGGLADLPFPRKIHDELIANGRAEPHGAGFPGVVTYHIREEKDVPGAIELFRTNYHRAKATAERHAASAKKKETDMTKEQKVDSAKPGVQKFTIQDARDWMEYSGVSLADVLNEDETPGVKLGAVGFVRAPEDATTDFEFAYDEVLIITKGKCTVSTGNETVTAQVGEVIYLPAGTPGRFHNDEDIELVYVASSSYGEVNREAKASLLNPE